MYIHKCIHYNYLVLHSGAHIKEEHILTESEQDTSNKHTQNMQMKLAINCTTLRNNYTGMHNNSVVILNKKKP